MIIKKYVEIFGNEDCPCNSCNSGMECKSSQKDNHTDLEREIVETKSLIQQLLTIDKAKSKYEKDYLIFKETGELPSEYYPSEYDSKGFDLSDDDFELNPAKCPYIQEYVYYNDYDDELKTECNNLAVENGYKDYVDEIYETYKGVEIVNGLTITKIE